MRRFSLVVVAALLLLPELRAAPFESDWQAVDQTLGVSGKDLPGAVRRYGLPRTDLDVRIDALRIEPALALGSWAAFRGTEGQETMTMGDLVLLEPEVDPVIGELAAGGFEILAIHNHLIGETPHLVYVHFHGHGDAAALAKTLRSALGKTKTPAPSAHAAPATPDQEKAFQKLQESLGRKGSLSGPVLQIGVPRAAPIQEDGMEIPAGMGMSTALNFQTVGAQIATTGDFVLVANEVNPVIRELRAHGIRATALHSHMLRETPRLFFLHFWGVGSPEEIGAGLKAALARVATA
jgi:Domain of Unknown Function (DUF1259)